VARADAWRLIESWWCSHTRFSDLRGASKAFLPAPLWAAENLAESIGLNRVAKTRFMKSGEYSKTVSG
jgi:hypothetical protein